MSGQPTLHRACALLLALGWLAAWQAGPAHAADTVNDVTQLNPIQVDRVVEPASVEEVRRLVAGHPGPVSIGGGRYSQGGQIATEGALFLDMRKLDRILEVDRAKMKIRVQAGITWRKIQEAIAPQGLALRIMQSYSNFTVGGSLSVNVHGRYVGEGPLIRAVDSIKLVLADGTVKVASRAESSELFFGAIGGYGGIGVIVEATLELVPDVAVLRESRRMDIGEYRKYFFDTVRSSKRAIFHNADLYPPSYSRVNAVTWWETDEPVTVAEKLAPSRRLTSTEQFVLSWFTRGPFGKQARQYLFDPYLYRGKLIEWRNYEASYDVLSLEPESREKSTYVLQEYFVPVEHFNSFLVKMAHIFKENRVNVLNVSIRHALPDPGSLLAWARSEVFAFVIYYEQGTTDASKRAVKAWTGKLISAALADGGTYYLPYQIIASPEQFAHAYPRASEYFALKTKVDPTYKLRNKLWDRYYPVR